MAAGHVLVSGSSSSSSSSTGSSSSSCASDAGAGSNSSGNKCASDVASSAAANQVGHVSRFLVVLCVLREEVSEAKKRDGQCCAVQVCDALAGALALVSWSSSSWTNSWSSSIRQEQQQSCVKYMGKQQQQLRTCAL
jgi:hypothetical protein